MAKLIVPTEITDARLTSSTIPENDATAWSNTATYNSGNDVMQEHGVYRALQSVPATQDPTDNPVDSSGNPYWLFLRPTNRWALFDEVVSTTTTFTGSQNYVLTPGVRINSIAIINATNLASVRIKVTSVAGGGTVYDQTIAGTDSSAVTNWYQYFSAPIITLSRIVRLDIPNFADNIVTVTFTAATGATCAIGVLVIGEQLDLGQTAEGMEPNFRNYDVTRRNSFGQLTRVVRGSSRTLNIETLVELASFDHINDTIEGLLSQNMVMVASPLYTSGTVYGYIKTHRLRQRHGGSLLSIQFEGLV